MINNSLGLTASHLSDPDGNLLHIPYRIAGQGLFLFSSAADLALLVLPISAIEDLRFLRLLGQKGIYRIEDLNGSVARVGEGLVIDRLCRHRTNPMLLAQQSSPSTVNSLRGREADRRTFC